MKVFGFDHIPDNCSIEPHIDGGYIVGASLNIPEKMLNFVPKCNVRKGEEFYVYFLYRHIETRQLRPHIVKQIYDELIDKAMYNMRCFKQLFLEHEKMLIINGQRKLVKQ